CTRKRRNVCLLGEDALCGLARPVKQGAHRSDRDIKRQGDLLVAEVGERVEEERVPLWQRHRCESTREPRVKRRAIGSGGGGPPLVVAAPATAPTATGGAQAGAWGPPARGEEVRRAPEQPRQPAAAGAAAGAAFEGGRDRPRGELVGETPANPPMEIPMHGH